eukprot:11636660-Alexandrium_andersonii.AAC.1
MGGAHKFPATPVQKRNALLQQTAPVQATNQERSCQWGKQVRPRDPHYMTERDQSHGPRQTVRQHR